MTTTPRTDPLSVSNPENCNVMSLRQLRQAGVSSRRAARLCGPDGPWRRLHPGVVLLRNIEPTRHQLLHAAVARYGPEMVITGADALRAHGMKCALTKPIHLLVPTDCRITARDGIRSSRTARLPEPVMVDGLPFAPPARAALDLARLERDAAEINYLLTLPLYWGACDKAGLQAELEAGNQRGSAAVRAALSRLNEHESYAHGLATGVLQMTKLPPPQWNVTVCDLRGRRIGEADAWWDEVGLAWQYRPSSVQPSGGFSHLALTATGIILVRCAVGQLQRAPHEVAGELHRAYARAIRTPRPKVRGVRAIGNAA